MHDDLLRHCNFTGLCQDPILVVDDDQHLCSEDEIQEALKRAVEKLGESSKLFVYFGGHGYDDDGLTVVLPQGWQGETSELFVLQYLVIEAVAKCKPLQVMIISATCRPNVMEDVDWKVADLYLEKRFYQ